MPQYSIDLDNISSFGGSNFPVGKHRARLISADERPSAASGNPTVYWEWEGADEESKGETVLTTSSLQDNALGSPTGFKAHLEAFGFRGQVDVDTDDLIGKYAMLVFNMEKRRDTRNGYEESERLTLKAIMPDEKPAARSPGGGNGSGSGSLSRRIGGGASVSKPSTRLGTTKAEQDDLPF